MQQDIEFHKNEDALKLAASSVRRHLTKIYKGGGQKKKGQTSCQRKAYGTRTNQNVA